MARGTRERLLDVGLVQFARHGFAATTVTDLEGRAGLRPGSGSFYRHFPSKDELFLAVAEREIERVRRSFESNLAAEAAESADADARDTRRTLLCEFRRVLCALSRLDALSAIVSRDRAALGPLAEQVDTTITGGVAVDAELLTALMDAGRIPRRDPRALAATLACALAGYHSTTACFGAPYGDVAADELIAVLVELVVN